MTIIKSRVEIKGSNINSIVVESPDVEIYDNALVITKVLDVETVQNGGNINYIIEIRNNSRATAQNVIVSDILTDCLDYVAAATTAEYSVIKYKAITREITIKLGDIEAKESVMVKITVKVNA